jgi:hypothetical protein
MSIRRSLAVAGASTALVLAPASAALAAGTSVSVRVEGRTSTMLAPKVVHTHSGSVTKGGAAKGSCPASTAAGALDAATHGHWQGKLFSGTPGIFVTSIFAVKPTGNYYWTVFVDYRTAQHGICSLKLHKGEQLLFAVTDGSQFPIVLSGPARATVGRPFEVKAFYYKPTPKRPLGVPTPVAGAHVGGAITNKHGTVTLTAQHAGRLKYTATETGYVRSAPVTVRVS